MYKEAYITYISTTYILLISLFSKNSLAPNIGGLVPVMVYLCKWYYMAIKNHAAQLLKWKILNTSSEKDVTT